MVMRHVGREATDTVARERPRREGGLRDSDHTDRPREPARPGSGTAEGGRALNRLSIRTSLLARVSNCSTRTSSELYRTPMKLGTTERPHTIYTQPNT
jgi:hypothetical protein